MLSTTFPNADTTPVAVINSETEPNTTLMSADQSDKSTITPTSVIDEKEKNVEQNDRTVEVHIEVDVTVEMKEKTEAVLQNAIVSPNLSLSDNNTDGECKPKGNAGTVTHASPDNFPFDFILMDIQMPVMGESDLHY